MYGVRKAVSKGYRLSVVPYLSKVLEPEPHLCDPPVVRLITPLPSGSETGSRERVGDGSAVSRGQSSKSGTICASSLHVPDLRGVYL